MEFEVVSFLHGSTDMRRLEEENEWVSLVSGQYCENMLGNFIGLSYVVQSGFRPAQRVMKIIQHQDFYIKKFKNIKVKQILMSYI